MAGATCLESGKSLQSGGCPESRVELGHRHNPRGRVTTRLRSVALVCQRGIGFECDKIDPTVVVWVDFRCSACSDAIRCPRQFSRKT